MSLIQITCPQCQNIINFKSYETIQYDELLSLAPYSLKCDHCGYVNSVIYQSIVKYPQQSQLIYVLPPNEKLNDELFNKGLGLLQQDDTLNSRLVTSENELIEKLLILNSDLDDRIVELVKLEAHHFVEQNDPQFNILHMLLNRDKEGFFLALFLDDGQSITLEVDPEVFSIADRKYRQILREFEMSAFIQIDASWGQRVMDSYLKQGGQ